MRALQYTDTVCAKRKRDKQVSLRGEARVYPWKEDDSQAKIFANSPCRMEFKHAIAFGGVVMKRLDGLEVLKSELFARFKNQTYFYLRLDHYQTVTHYQN